MPDLDLAELRALTAAALPAPWTLTRGHDGWDLGAGPHGIVTTGAGMRAQDAALIVTARNALPELLDRIDRLETVVSAVSDFRTWSSFPPGEADGTPGSAWRRVVAGLDALDD